MEYINHLLHTYVLFAVPSSSPIGFHGYVKNATSIMFVWEPPTPEYTNGDITGYIIIINATVLEREEERFTQSNNITLNDLHPYTIYEVVIAATTVAGVGPFSNPPLILQTDESCK